MEILYEEPKETPANWTWLADRVDKDGNRFWFDWGEWIRATDIESPDSIKLLPEKIANLYSKWVKDLEDMKNKDNDYLCPIKNVSIHFIYIDKVYKLTPDAFSSDYMTRYYFEDAHEIIEKDLQDAGCIYTLYWGDLD